MFKTTESKNQIGCGNSPLVNKKNQKIIGKREKFIKIKEIFLIFRKEDL